MSGWGKTCDQVDDLDGFPPLTTAARHITFALDGPGSFNKVGAAIRAGAYLRAYRRTLPYQGTKRADHSVGDRATDEELLWQALAAVAAISSYQRQRWFDALSVRRAEACLRVWWKRQQEVAQ